MLGERLAWGLGSPTSIWNPISVVMGTLWSLSRKESWRHQKHTAFHLTLVAVVSGLRGQGGKKGRGHVYDWKLGSNKEGELPFTSFLQLSDLQGRK